MSYDKPRDPRKEQLWRRWLRQWRRSGLTEKTEKGDRKDRKGEPKRGRIYFILCWKNCRWWHYRPARRR